MSTCTKISFFTILIAASVVRPTAWYTSDRRATGQNAFSASKSSQQASLEADPVCPCLQCQVGTVLLGGSLLLNSELEDQCALDQHVYMAAVKYLQAMVFAVDRINSDYSLIPNMSLAFRIQDTCSLEPAMEEIDGVSVIQNQPVYVDEPTVEYFQNVLKQILSQKFNSSGSGPADAPMEALPPSSIVTFFHTAPNGSTIQSFLYRSQVPVISHGPSSPTLHFGSNDSFHTTDVHIALIMADKVGQFNWSHVIFLYSNDSFGERGLEVLLENIESGPECVTIELIPLPSEESDAEFDCVAARMNRPSVRDASAVLVYGSEAQGKGLVRAVHRLLSTDCGSPLRYLTWVGADALSFNVTDYGFLMGALRVEKSSSATDPDFQEIFTPWASGRSNFTSVHISAYGGTDTGGKDTEKECGDTHSENTEIASLIHEAFAQAEESQEGVKCLDYDLCSDIFVYHSAGLSINSSMLRRCLLQNLSCHTNQTTFSCGSYFIQNLQKFSNGSLGFLTVGCWDVVNRLVITGEVQLHTRQDGDDSCDGLQYSSSPCEYSSCPNGSRPEYPRLSGGCWVCVHCPGENSVGNGEFCYACPNGTHPNQERSACERNALRHISLSPEAYFSLSCITYLGLAVSVLVGIFYIWFRHLLRYDLHLRVILWLTVVLLYIMALLFLNLPSDTNCLLRCLLGVCLSLCFGPLLARAIAMFRVAINLNIYRPPLFVGYLSQLFVASFFVLVQIAITVLWLELDTSTVEFRTGARVTEVKCGGDYYVSLVVNFFFNIILSLYSFFYSCRCIDDLPENAVEAMFCKSVIGISFLLSTMTVTFAATMLLTAFVNDGAEFYEIVPMVVFVITMASFLLGCTFLTSLYHIITNYYCQERHAFASGLEGHPKSVPVPGQPGLRLTADGKRVKALTREVVDDGKRLLSFNSRLSIKRLHTLLYGYTDLSVPIYEMEAEKFVDPIVTADGRVLKVHTEPVFSYDAEKAKEYEELDPVYIYPRICDPIVYTLPKNPYEAPEERDSSSSCVEIARTNAGILCCKPRSPSSESKPESEASFLHKARENRFSSSKAKVKIHGDFGPDLVQVSDGKYQSSLVFLEASGDDVCGIGENEVFDHSFEDGDIGRGEVNGENSEAERLTQDDFQIYADFCDLDAEGSDTGRGLHLLDEDRESSPFSEGEIPVSKWDVKTGDCVAKGKPSSDAYWPPPVKTKSVSTEQVSSKKAKISADACSKSVNTKNGGNSKHDLATIVDDPLRSTSSGHQRFKINTRRWFSPEEREAFSADPMFTRDGYVPDIDADGVFCLQPRSEEPKGVASQKE